MATDRLVRRLGQVSRNLSKGVERTVARVTAEIGDRVVTGTPVDTGFARGNWRPSINSPQETPITFNDPTGGATIGRIQVVGRRYRVGDTIFLRNNAPYIVNLNRGSSPQADPGFIQEAARDGFESALREIESEGLDL